MSGERRAVATRSRKPRRSRHVVRWVALGAIVLVGLLYARPLKSYFETKHDLARRAAEVRGLKAQRRALEHRLAQESTGVALTQEARQLGLVRPGEKLFIVKGISAWLKSRATIDRGGR